MKRAITLTAVFGLFVGLSALPASAALTSGVYQTLPGATVVETGDLVPNRTRVMPISAILTFDLEASPPSLTAMFSNALLEGDEPAPLTVRSLSGARFSDGSYWFTGDYLRDLYPGGTQYGFNWRFSTSANSEVIWNGDTGWWGGRLWNVTISNITLVLRPPLEIARTGSKVTVSWPAANTGFVLEQAADLPTAKWDTVKDPAELVGDRFSVTLEAGASQGYFRLRKN